VRVGQPYKTLIPLSLALSREGRGERIKVKGVNAFVLAASLNTLFAAALPGTNGPYFSKIALGIKAWIPLLPSTICETLRSTAKLDRE